jgi:hypothetical protein
MKGNMHEFDGILLQAFQVFVRIKKIFDLHPTPVNYQLPFLPGPLRQTLVFTPQKTPPDAFKLHAMQRQR